MKKNYQFLNDINFPSDLRKVSENNLQKVADEVREEMISAVSETGGHLGAGLGVVELTVALHYVFDSNTKYESGSGWPSFYESLPDVFETKIDYHLGYDRTEYHCKKCGGHHGHIFEDGPKPTGKRFCNNGVCLVFKPKS